MKEIFSSRFITFEGGEGAGKTTQIKLLGESLAASGLEVVMTREPGGTLGAEAIRELILNVSQLDFSPLTETFLFFAARRDHIEKVILPAKKRGAVILCDRFVDSTRAYQGVLGHVDAATIDILAQLTLGELRPDATIIIDLDPEMGLSRAALRRGSAVTDRFEAESLEFHSRIRERFLQIANAEPDRCLIVSGLQSQRELSKQIYTRLTAKITSYAE